MTLKDVNVALLEARMSGEMADMIRRYGGEPISVPAVRESALESRLPVAAFLDQLRDVSLPVVVFFTGVGVNALLKEADQLGRLSELLAILRRATVVCRGPKPAAPLRRAGVPIAINVREPYTTSELIEALDGLELSGKDVRVVQYGERNSQMVRYLQERGAVVSELCLYEWRLPEDIAPLQKLVHELIAHRIDAIIFTSQIQVRHLFLIAEASNLVHELSDALNTRTIVASIGPTCTGVLQDYGVAPHVIPEHPKMGHLIKALADYMERR